SAVVNGGTGTCISLFAPSARVQPSGLTTVAGGLEGTRPSADAAASGGGGAASGSAPDEGSPSTDVARQTPRTATLRTTPAIGLTGDTIRTFRLESPSLLTNPANLLCVRN